MLREIEEAMNTIYRRSSQLHEVTIGGAPLILIIWRQKPEECPQVIGQEVKQYMEAALRGPAGNL